jgi:hypothetical protein
MDVLIPSTHYRSHRGYRTLGPKGEARDFRGDE